MHTPILTPTASHPPRTLSQTPKRPVAHSFSSVSSMGSNSSLSLLPDGEVEEVTEEGVRHAELKLEARCVLASRIFAHATLSAQPKVYSEAQINCASSCRIEALT